MDILVKLIKTLTAILIFVVVILLMYKFASKIIIETKIVSKGSGSRTKPVTEQYSVTSLPTAGGFYIQFKNVVGTAANIETPVYYNIDLTLETKSEDALAKMNANQQYTVEIIRDTIGKFRKEDALNEKGKQYLKLQLEKKLAQVYGEGSIKEIYIEKFLYK